MPNYQLGYLGTWIAVGIKRQKIDDKWVYVVTASRRAPKNAEGTEQRVRHQRKRYANSLPEAKQLERQLFDELDEVISGKRLLTWNEFFEIYVEHTAKENGKRPSTTDTEFCRLKKHVTPRWGTRLLRDITTSDVKQLIIDAVGHLNPQTKKALAGHIRSVFKLAQEHGQVTKNPAQGVTYKVQPRPKKLPSYEQVRLILTTARDRKVPWYPLWWFLAHTGCRSGEAYALRWRNVDLASNSIFVIESWTRKGGFRDATKNGEGRTISVNPELKMLLEELHSVTFEGPNSFVLPRIREWTQSEAAKSLKLFILGLDDGIPPMRLHDFRSFFVTELLRRGVDLPKVMRLVDHKRLETTMRYVALAGLDVKNSTDVLSFLTPQKAES